MKNLGVLVCLLALGVAVGFAITRPLNADSARAVSVAASALPGNDAEAAKTFTGRISLMDGKYVLMSGTSAFQLDNQEKAKAFEGQNVKVTGTLDAATNTIKVADIQTA